MAEKKSNVKRCEIFKADRTRDRHDQWPEDEERWYFNAVAGNNKVVGTSELYNTSHNAERAARDIHPDAEIKFIEDK